LGIGCGCGQYKQNKPGHVQRNHGELGTDLRPGTFENAFGMDKWRNDTSMYRKDQKIYTDEVVNVNVTYFKAR